MNKIIKSAEVDGPKDDAPWWDSDNIERATPELLAKPDPSVKPTGPRKAWWHDRRRAKRQQRQQRLDT